MCWNSAKIKLGLVVDSYDVKEAVMIDITEYLEEIFRDFKAYIDGDENLCKFKELNFEAGALPDYNDINIQQLYLLRYAFAYGFEYSRMYLKVLQQLGNVEQISVSSIGCGSMIDYWSLVHALKNKSMAECRVRYVGIDEIDWNYKIDKRNIDDVHFLNGNAKKYFANNDKFISDIYFFPKSISEFSDDEMDIITSSFASKPITKDKFFVCISIREDQGSMDRDVQKTKSIISAIEKNGFVTSWPYAQYTYFTENKGIVTYDNDFCYPQNALEYITKLNTECTNYRIQGSNCRNDCDKYLNRWPVLKTGHIRYQVIMFERR